MYSVTWGLERFDENKRFQTTERGGDPVLRIIEFMVKEFTERELTRDDDILDAFSGVGAYISQRSGSPLCLGLSEKHMFGCLLWKLRGDYSQGKTSFASKHRPGFPTWTWASRYGPVHCSGNFYECCFDNGSNTCNVDNWALAYVWMDIYIAGARGDIRRLDCREVQDHCIDITKLLLSDSIQSLSTFLVKAPRKADCVEGLPPLRGNTLLFRTFSFERSIKEPGRYATFWACGRPRSIWNNKNQEIGCVYVDDIDFAEYEGEAELLLISLVERIPGPLDREKSYGFGSRFDRLMGIKDNPQEKKVKDDKRRVGYFNVMWVVNDERLPGMKRRVGTGVILTEFMIGQVEKEIKSGMVDVLLF